MYSLHSDSQEGIVWFWVRLSSRVFAKAYIFCFVWENTKLVKCNFSRKTCSYLVELLLILRQHFIQIVTGTFLQSVLVPSLLFCNELWFIAQSSCPLWMVIKRDYLIIKCMHLHNCSSACCITFNGDPSNRLVKKEPGFVIIDIRHCNLAWNVGCYIRDIVGGR